MITKKKKVNDTAEKEENHSFDCITKGEGKLRNLKKEYSEAKKALERIMKTRCV